MVFQAYILISVLYEEIIVEIPVENKFICKI
jgi:formate-dependent nitrite reductase membrane component NrfD